VPVEAPPPPPPPQLINAKLSAINTVIRIIKKRISVTIGFVPMSLLLYSSKRHLEILLDPACFG
jgi:hypothetical protein